MLTCQSCGGIVAPGQPDCPHCGSSLITSAQGQSISAEPLYAIVPQYHRGLIFRQNLPAILFFSLAIALPYMLPALIPIAINPDIFTPTTLKIVLILSYLVAYGLAILTMLAYLKNITKATKLLVYNNKMEYYSRATKGMSKSIMGILNIDTISVEQSEAQKKYNVGTLSMSLKFKMGNAKETFSYTRKIKNVEQAEQYCARIKDLRDAAKALVS